MTTKDIYSQSEHHMKRSIETLKENLMKIRTGRAHTGLLEHITVDYYGCPTPISQVAQLGLADARTITVQPWEKKMVAVVEKAIRNSDLGLNPATSGEVIRVPMPPLTEERRRMLAKQSKQEAETAKISVRNARRDAIEAIKKSVKADGTPEDVAKDAEAEVQKVHDKFIKKVDDLYAAKEKEIMTV